MSGRQSQKKGKRGEEMIHWVLNTMFDCIEPVFTGWKIIRWVDRKRGLAHVVAAEKVAGDFTAVERGTGRSVLVEVKSHKGDRLPFSVMTKRRKTRKTTQAQDLDEHAEANGRSILAWNADAGVFILEWPIPGFIPGTSLNEDEAARLTIYKEG